MRNGKIILIIRRLLALSFFRRIEEPLSTWPVVTWWERRRLLYNLVLGFAGFITIFLSLISGLIGEKFLGVAIGIPDPPIFAIFAVIAYAIMANICYTGGWVTELIVASVWGLQGQYFGKISFALGFIFSILLTLIPGVLIVLMLGVELLKK